MTYKAKQVEKCIMNVLPDYGKPTHKQLREILANNRMFDCGILFHNGIFRITNRYYYIGIFYVNEECTHVRVEPKMAYEYGQTNYFDFYNDIPNKANVGILRNEPMQDLLVESGVKLPSIASAIDYAIEKQYVYFKRTYWGDKQTMSEGCRVGESDIQTGVFMDWVNFFRHGSHKEEFTEDSLMHSTELTICYKPITKIPTELLEYVNLEYLFLDHNILDCVPKQLGHLCSLKELYLNDNRLTSLPSSIKRLKNLKVLYLQGNDISDTEKAKIQTLLPNCKIEF